MKTQNITKQTAKKIAHVLYQQRECKEMDYMMDGSGECGHFIEAAYEKSVKRIVDELLNQANITLNILIEKCDEWIKLELEKGPKNIWVGYTKKTSILVPKCYNDTVYAPLKDELRYLYQI